ncbi:MAG: multicopper oxidase domain-containing protein [Dehalococcoidia bacterium]
MSRIPNRVKIVLAALAIAVLGALSPISPLGPAQSGGSEGQPPPAGQVCRPTRTMTLYAEVVGDGFGYGRTPSTASIPGPTIEMREGQCLAITLVNHLADDVSIHTHGLDYTVESDGTPLSESCTPPGGRRTYVFGAHAPTQRDDRTTAPGSAGYWHYHDHCMGTDHGTTGVNSGLFGALIVRRPGDPLPDRPPFVVVMVQDSINLKYAPNTPVFEANVGERVEFVVIGHGDLFHTFHLHAHRWADTRTGLLATIQDSSPVIDDKTLGPGDSFGFQVIAGERVGPGAWMYHCHVQEHSDGGMSGIFMVRDAGGRVTAAGEATLAAWRAAHAGMTHEGH